MCLLVRKIDKAKWVKNSPDSVDDVSADAITRCSTTRANALSVWEVPSREDVDSAVLAMMSGADHVESVDVVALPSSSVNSAGLELSFMDGRTPIDDLAESHRNISNLTYRSLGDVAGLILAELRSGRVVRYSATAVARLLDAAIREGRVDETRLAESVRMKIRDLLPSSGHGT